MDAKSETLWNLGALPTIAAALNAVMSIGLPAHLQEPKSIDELTPLADSIIPAKLHRTLLVLQQYGYFSYDEPSRKWSNSEKTQAFLNVPGFSDAYTFLTNPFQYEALANFPDALRQEKSATEIHFGAPFFDTLYSRPEDARKFHTSLGGYTKVQLPHLLKALDLTSITRVLDVGGGNGTFLCELAQANPAIVGNVVDLRGAYESASQNINSYDLGERVSFAICNFFECVPGGFDAIVLKQVLYSWNDEKAKTILQNCRNALHPGNKIFIIEHLAARGNSDYLNMMFLDLHYITHFDTKMRTHCEYEDLLEATGFRFEKITKAGMQYVIEGTAK